MSIRFATMALLLAGSLAAHAAGEAPAPGRAAVLEQAAVVLETRYVDADKAATLAAMLRAAARDGRFADAAAPDAFVAAVTRALREAVPDKHLRLSYEPEHEFDVDAGAGGPVQRRDAGGATRMVMRTARIDPRSQQQIAQTNFGVDGVEHLEGNIGYLRLSRFVPTDYSGETLRAAIALLAHSTAVVIDLRDNIGGAPDAVRVLLSPFFPGDGPVELHVTENRARGIRDEIRSDPALSRPALVAAPLYILVNGKTASAAEMFAYAAQRLGRAVVVGEKSSGAGNGGVKQSIGEGFALFVPEWRTLTGPGWEGTGVQPDVAVASDEALAKALALARAANGPAAAAN